MERINQELTDLNAEEVFTRKSLAVYEQGADAMIEGAKSARDRIERIRLRKLELLHPLATDESAIEDTVRKALNDITDSAAGDVS